MERKSREPGTVIFHTVNEKVKKVSTEGGE